MHIWNEFKQVMNWTQTASDLPNDTSVQMSRE
jgi:hypothetical protein